jgi:hypothetical protein
MMPVRSVRRYPVRSKIEFLLDSAAGQLKVSSFLTFQFCLRVICELLWEKALAKVCRCFH